MISVEQLRKIMPHLSAPRAAAMLPHLLAAMREFAVNTPLRAAAFVAQIAHESGELQYMQEIASGSAYEGREDLGNTRPEAMAAAKRRGTTPGCFYKGHGPIQTTGYDNHKRVGEKLGIDAVDHPELLALPENGFRAAGLFWTDKGLNAYADMDMRPAVITRRKVKHTVPAFDAITFRVNGGFNGRAERLQYFARAKEVLGC